jgi:hypothetical protein
MGEKTGSLTIVNFRRGPPTYGARFGIFNRHTKK